MTLTPSEQMATFATAVANECKATRAIANNTKSEVASISTTYATKASLASVATSGEYSDLSGVPTALKNPTALTLQNSAGTSIGSYDGSTATTVKLTSSTVGLGNVTNESKATMFTSAALTGTPTAPTAAAGTNTTQVATTAFVTTAVANKTSVSGNAGTATKLATAKTITLSGDVSGSADFDGSQGITITTTITDDSHNHIIGNVDGLQTALNAKAPLASPSLTGTPKAPTATAGTNTTQIATTAFVTTAVSTAESSAKSYTDTKVANLVNSAPETLDTLGELATALSDNVEVTTALNAAIGSKANNSEVVKLSGNQTIAGTKTFSSTISGSISGNAGTATKASQDGSGNVITSTYATKASLASVATSGKYSDLSGAPTALKNPTALILQNSSGTSIGSYDGSTATTVKLTASTVGLGNVTNESKATMLTSAALTGTPTAPTATAGTNTTQIATTAFVTTAVANKTSVSGNAGTATKLASAVTLSLTGDVSGSVSFDGSKNASITATVVDDSHNHVISNVDGLQTALDGKAAKASGVFYIEGTGDTAGSWLGSHEGITSYYPGLMVAYKPSIAGVSDGTTLDINGLGAVPIVRNVTSAVTTHYGVNSILFIVYTVDSSGTAYWKIADYDSDTKTRSSNKSATKMYLIGAQTQSTSGQTTYSNSKCYIGTDNCLYSNGSKVSTSDTNTTYSLSKSGSTIILTGSDGSTTSVTDADTTYSLSSFGVTATATELNYVDGVTSNVQTQLNAKAPLVSPALTGTPTAPTATAGTNTTQVATTAFVTTAVANKTSVASATKATQDASGNVITSTYATKASPTFTGTPTAPTASAGTNTTQIATTAFVTTAVANKTSVASATKATQDGSGNVITSTYATKTELGGKADASSLNNYLPLSGGNVTGHVYLTGAKENSSTSNTSQIVFGTADNNHVALSSNANALVINPSTTATTNQIVLYLDKASQFPSGISANLYGNASTATKATQDANGNVITSTYLTKTDASSTYLGKTAKASSATTADSATKATQDGSGNVITSTYATKTELTSGLSSKANSATTLSGYGITDAYTKSQTNSNFIGWDRGALDVDTLYDTGLYMVASGTNVPSGSKYGVVLTMPYRQMLGNTKTDFGAQIFLPNGDDNTHPNSMFFRTSLGASWNAWQEAATTAWVRTFVTNILSGISGASVSQVGDIKLFHGSLGGSDGRRPVDGATGVADEAWELCDGTNGTPDMRGKLAYGAGGTLAVGAAHGAAATSVDKAGFDYALGTRSGQTTATVMTSPPLGVGLYYLKKTS